MIDTHSHIYCDAFDIDRDEVIARAQQAGVTHIILPNEGPASVERVKLLHSRYPQFTSMALGLHPEEVRDDFRDVLNTLRPMLDIYPYVAVGEIGIDLYWDKTFREQQMEALDTQLRWCVEKDIPFIMHSREALDEILWVLDNFGNPLPKGVFHCFSGTAADVERVRQRGDFYFGIGGVLTFKKSTLHELLPVIGLDRILLETDSPYMAPVPHRGKRNESAFVAAVRDSVAQWLNVTPEHVDCITTDNALNLFKSIKPL